MEASQREFAGTHINTYWLSADACSKVHKVVIPVTSTEGKSYSEFVDRTTGGVKAVRQLFPWEGL